MGEGPARSAERVGVSTAVLRQDADGAGCAPPAATVFGRWVCTAATRMTYVRSVLPPRYFAYCSTARTSWAGSRRLTVSSSTATLGWMRRRFTGLLPRSLLLRRLPGGGARGVPGPGGAAARPVAVLARDYGLGLRRKRRRASQN